MQLARRSEHRAWGDCVGASGAILPLKWQDYQVWQCLPLNNASFFTRCKHQVHPQYIDLH